LREICRNIQQRIESPNISATFTYWPGTDIGQFLIVPMQTGDTAFYCGISVLVKFQEAIALIMAPSLYAYTPSGLEAVRISLCDPNAMLKIAMHATQMLWKYNRGAHGRSQDYQECS
jgi:hypothetical protein